MSQLEADQTFAVWQKSSVRLADLERSLRVARMAGRPEATALAKETEALRSWTQLLYELAAFAHRQNQVGRMQKRNRR